MNMQFCIAVLLFQQTLPQSQPPSAPRKAVARPAESKPQLSLVERIASVLGVRLKPPPPMRGPEHGQGGELWIVRPGDQDYKIDVAKAVRWPIFSLAGDSVFACAGDEILGIPLNGKRVRPIGRIKGITKLVGVDRTAPQTALAVIGGTTVARISLVDGRVLESESLPANDDMLNHLLSAERYYDNVSIFTERQSFLTTSGEQHRENVYRRVADGAAEPLTACRNMDCIQPSWSPTSGKLAYVRKGGVR